jgi:hypothetical protein
LDDFPVITLMLGSIGTRGEFTFNCRFCKNACIGDQRVYGINTCVRLLFIVLKSPL